MKIFILRTFKSETAPKFLNHLKHTEEGYDRPNGEYFIINYGRLNSNAHLNGKIVGNKLQQLLILKNKGLNVPEILSCNPATVANSKPLTRSLLHFSKFPLLARKEKHSKGKDIIFLKTRWSIWKRAKRVAKREFFIKYIPKEAEFRVHVLGNEAPNISQKVHSEKFNAHHPHVWCTLRGWTLVDYEGQYSDELRELGIQAVKALGYDFGAVDIGLGKDGKFYVFEVNSAPRLSRTRRRLYANYFRQKEKEYRRHNR